MTKSRDEIEKENIERSMAIDICEAAEKKLGVLKKQLDLMPDSIKKTNLKREWDRNLDIAREGREILNKVSGVPSGVKIGLQNLQDNVVRLEQFVNKEFAEHHKIAGSAPEIKQPSPNVIHKHKARDHHKKGKDKVVKEPTQHREVKAKDDNKKGNAEYSVILEKDRVGNFIDSTEKTLGVLKTQLDLMPDSTKRTNLKKEWDRNSTGMKETREMLETGTKLPIEVKKNLEQLGASVSRLQQFVNKEFAEQHKIAEKSVTAPRAKK